MQSEMNSSILDRTFFRRIMTGGMTSTIFGVVTFAMIFISAISMEIEETLLNMTVLWGTIALLVSLVAGIGLAIGFRYCNSKLFRIIVFALPLVITIAAIYGLFYTDAKSGIALAGLLLLPTSATIAGCSFATASAVTVFQNWKLRARNAG